MIDNTDNDSGAVCPVLPLEYHTLFAFADGFENRISL